MSDQTYELTDEEYDQILQASRSVRYMVVGGVEPSSPQENANRAWQSLGRKRGFDWTTVRKGQHAKQIVAAALGEVSDE